MNMKQLVQAGYDRVSQAYRSDDGASEYNYSAWIAELLSMLGSSPRVLDLGCGCGVPATRLLASHGRVTGVDFSHVQVERARRLVPDADFICEDMCAVRFPPESFDAVVSFYAIFHLPLDEQPTLFRRIAEWLPLGGRFMATLGTRSWTGTEDNWLGVPDARMWWSHAGATTCRGWLEDAGFSIVREAFIPEGSSGCQLFHAQRTV